MFKQFVTFTGVGAIGTAGHYLVLIVLASVVGISPVVATTCGFIVGAIINYQLNYIYTFKSDAPHRTALPKFFTVALIGAGINMAIIYWGTELLGIHYLLMQLVATGVVLLWNFLINRVWTYSSRSTSAQESP